jgi:hypothetical protein
MSHRYYYNILINIGVHKGTAGWLALILLPLDGLHRFVKVKQSKLATV